MVLVEGIITFTKDPRWVLLEVTGFDRHGQRRPVQLRVLRRFLNDRFVPEPDQDVATSASNCGGIGLVECQLVGDRTSLGSQMVLLPTHHRRSQWGRYVVDAKIITTLQPVSPARGRHHNGGQPATSEAA